MLDDLFTDSVIRLYWNALRMQLKCALSDLSVGKNEPIRERNRDEHCINVQYPNDLPLPVYLYSS